MNPIVKIAFKYSFIQLIWLLIAWYIIDQTLLLPDFIPYTPIKTGGIPFTFIPIITLLFFQKELINSNSNLTVGQLTLYGAVVWFITEVFFQSIRQFTLTEDRWYYFLTAVAGMTVFNSIISFLVAFQLKTKRIERLISIIVAIFVLFAILLKVFPNLVKP
jgi:hypothetical protein